MNQDYFVRYGKDVPNRTEYMTLKEAEKKYNKIELTVDSKITWKELIFENLKIENHQEILKSEEIKILDLGFCKMALPK